MRANGSLVRLRHSPTDPNELSMHEQDPACRIAFPALYPRKVSSKWRGRAAEESGGHLWLAKTMSTLEYGYLEQRKQLLHCRFTLRG